MAAINSFVAPLIGPVTHALLHFMWQGSLVAIALAIGLGLARNGSAAFRYLLSCIALLVMIILPIATAISYDTTDSRRFFSGSTGLLQAASQTSGAPASNGSGDVSNAGAISGNSRGPVRGWLATASPFLQRLRPWMFTGWILGICVLSLYHIHGWRRVQRLKHIDHAAAPSEWQETALRICRRLGVTRAVRVCQSTIAEVPMMIGWLSPIVLIPTSALTGLTSQQLHCILAHELAHVRRRDYLVNLIQVVTETMLFFHPAVWWVSQKIRIERENCCDDVAASFSESRLSYARALIRLEELRTYQAEFVLRANGGSLTRRIRRLVGGVNMSTRIQNRPWVTGTLVMSLLLVGGAALSLAVKDADTSANNNNIQLARAAGMGGVGESYDSAKGDFAIKGDWEIERFGDELVLVVKAKKRKNRMSMTIDFRPKDFTGLDYGDNDEFELRRDAGTFYFRGDFKGSGESIDGKGAYGFVSNRSFAGNTGVDDVSDNHLFVLAAEDVGEDYVKKLKNLGYSDLEGDDLVPLAIHGVKIEYIKEMRELGYDVSLEQLVAWRIHGVSPEFAKGMAELGYSDADAGDLVAWRIHGVSPEYVNDMKNTGVKGMTAEDLVAMRIHGVSSDFVEGMVQAGHESLDVEQLVAWRIHGVSPDFIKSMQKAGVKDISTDDLVAMRIHGISGEFVRGLADLGYKDVSVDDLVRMRIHGVTPSFVKKILKKTRENPSIDDLVKMKIHGIHL